LSGVIRVVGEVGNINRDHCDSVGKPHCGHPASQGVHARGATICQHHSEVWALNSNNQPGNSAASSNINDRLCGGRKCINKLTSVLNDLTNRPTA
jgi:hypothetical protein